MIGWRLAVGGWPLVRLAFGGWRLAFGGWRLAVGGWRLVVGGWLLVVGGWPFSFVFEYGWRLVVGLFLFFFSAVGVWWLAVGGCRLVVGGWQLAFFPNHVSLGLLDFTPASSFSFSSRASRSALGSQKKSPRFARKQYSKCSPRFARKRSIFFLRASRKCKIKMFSALRAKLKSEKGVTVYCDCDRLQYVL